MIRCVFKPFCALGTRTVWTIPEVAAVVAVAFSGASGVWAVATASNTATLALKATKEVDTTARLALDTAKSVDVTANLIQSTGKDTLAKLEANSSAINKLTVEVVRDLSSLNVNVSSLLEERKETRKSLESIHTSLDTLRTTMKEEIALAAKSVKSDCFDEINRRIQSKVTQG
eukprot:GILI01001350.1.p1 GENE.GILI01001350.1~~GILI01001350.1.p1  ORF type:complete len:173 (+),score=27.91 GILI01001350.1:49-567(+)